MNKRRNIYRGVNKRRNNSAKSLAASVIVVCLLGGVAYIKFFDFNIVDKFKQISIFTSEDSSKGLEEFKYEDIVDKGNGLSKKESDNIKGNEIAKVATTTDWDMYSIQIAALDNEEELKQIESKLLSSKIPFSIVEIDGVKKVQTYASFNEDESRKYIENIKKDFPDAFLSSIKVPRLGLEYTNKHSYVEDICKELNNLITNFNEESDFWAKTNENINIEEYKDIQDKRSEIVSNLEKQSKKINYDGMNAFKENLLEYTKSMDEKSKQSLKMAQKGDYNISKSLFMSCMQGYYTFINSIKPA